MTSRSPLLIVVVVVALVVGLTLWAQQVDSPTKEVAKPVKPAETREAPKPDPTAQNAASRETASKPKPVEEKPSTPGQTLAGRVLLKGDSTPVANAAVKLLVERGDSIDVKTDANGAFRFELDRPSLIRGVRIQATPNTTALDAWDDDAFASGEGAERTFFVTHGASLSGIVVDRSGNPVVGADVSAWCTANYPNNTPPDRTTTSAAGGHFILTNLGESFFVAANTRDQCCARGLRGKLAPDERVGGLEVVVAPCVTVRGHVVDDADVALAGATLRMEGAGANLVADNTSVAGVTHCDWGSADITCDANGAFEIKGLPGPEFRRSVWSEHETCSGDQVIVDSKVADNRLVLKRGVDVSGYVYLPDKSAGAGAEVVIGHLAGRIRKVTAGVDGTFVVRGVPASSKTVMRGHLPGYAIYSCNFVTETDTSAVEVHLEAGKSLAGVVIDEEGKLVPFANVRIEGDHRVDYEGISVGEPTTVEYSHGMQRTVADAAGEFRFDDLYDGSFEVRATDPSGIKGSGKVIARSGVEDLIVAFDASQTTTFAGSVVDAVTSEPIREFELTCMKPEKDSPENWNGKSKKFSTTDGRFRYGGIEIGMAELRVSAAGYAQATGGQQYYPAGVHQFDARLIPVRTLSLEFSRADGRRFEGGEVSASDVDGQALQLSLGQGNASSQVHVTAEPVQLSGLPARPITLHVATNGETFDYDLDLRVPTQGTQMVVLETVPKIDLEVTFRDTRGASGPDDPSFVREEVELILEDTSGRRVSKILVKPKSKGFDVTTRTGRNELHSPSEQPVARVSVPTTVASGRLRISDRALAHVTVPPPEGDRGIRWTIDVSKY